MHLDLDKTLVSRERIATRVAELGASLARDLERDLTASGHSPDQIVIIPVLTGALVFTADLIRCLPLKLSLRLVAVSSYPGKSMESKGVSIASELPKDLADKHVVIVDDILDSGQTLAVVRGLIEKQNPASVRCCVLLRKPPSARKAGGHEVRVDYVGFDIPDDFVVGYGLDYDGFYRNHPEIATLRKEAVGGAKG